MARPTARSRHCCFQNQLSGVRLAPTLRPPTGKGTFGLFELPFGSVQDLLSYEDVFAIGIGLDIAGAFLLAKGLLLSIRQIRNLSATYFDFSGAEVVARVEDRVSTYIGVAALALGFMCQLTGYVIGSMLSFNPSPSVWRAGAVVALALLAVGVVLLVYRTALPAWRKRLLIEFAHYDNHGLKQKYAYGAYLLILGTHMPPRVKDESEMDYAKRVWHVDQIIEGAPND